MHIESSILIPTLLLETLEIWDVRGMILVSLTLQIVLSVLGRRRKYKINTFFKTILWFAYFGADWIAIATLGKLLGSHAKYPTHAIRVYWAPLLLLHLGGPDTITAYALEDNKHWIRHLLTLVAKVIFVYFSSLPILGYLLIFGGIIKNVEKILCLKLNNSQKIKSFISSIFNPQGNPHSNENQTLDHHLEENPNVLLGYLLFTIMSPDVNDYLSFHNLVEIGRKIDYLKKTTSSDVRFMGKYIHASHKGDAFEVAAVALGFMFDVVYTKAALIYIKLAWLLRLTNFASSVAVLVHYVVEKNHFYNAGIANVTITVLLLSGAIAQEFYALWLILSSDWAIIVAEFHNNLFLSKLFKATLKCFPCLMRRGKRWSDRVGQFDLLKYCWRYKKRKANQWCGHLLKIIDCDITEMWNKNKCTKFENVPSDLKFEDTYQDLKLIVLEKSSRVSRGEKALQKRQQFDQLKWSIELDFDHSIIVWHLATSVCYLQEDDLDDAAMKISTVVSNYMMYLLAMFPALLFFEHGRSFWLDYTTDKLSELVSRATDIRNAASTLLEFSEREEELELSYCEHEEEIESRERTFKNLQSEVSELATFLKQSENKWEMIRDVWIEMLVHAAVSSQPMSHVKQLGEGIEFLSLIWLFVGLHVREGL